MRDRLFNVLVTITGAFVLGAVLGLAIAGRPS